MITTHQFSWKHVMWFLPLLLLGAGAGQAAPELRISNGAYACNASSCPVFDYGTINDLGIDASFTITNVGNAVAKQFTQALSGSQVPSVFSLVSDNCSDQLAVGGACTVVVKFRPLAADPAGTIYGNVATKVKLALTAKSASAVNAVFKGTKAVSLPPPTEPYAIDNTTMDAGWSNGNTGSHVHKILARDNNDVMAAWVELVGSTAQLMSALYNAAAGTWGTPVVVAVGPTSISRFELASDGDNYFLSWQEDNSSNHQAKVSRNSGGVWSAPLRIDTSNNAHYATVCAHPSGKAVVIFEDLDVFKMKRFNGTSWEANENIASDPSTTVTMGINCAMYGDGNIMIGWPKISYDGLYARHFIWDASPHWEGPQVQLTPVLNSSRLRFGFNSTGQGMAVWYAQSQSHARRFSPESGWGPQETFAGQTGGATAAYANVALDASGNAFVIYQQNDPATSSTKLDAFVRRNVWDGNAFVWETAVKIENDDTGDVFTPLGDYNQLPMAISVSSAGLAAAAWNQKNAAGINSVYIAQFDGSSWSAPVQVDSSQPANNAQFPCLHRRADGLTHITWSQFDGTRWNVHAKKID